MTLETRKSWQEKFTEYLSGDGPVYLVNLSAELLTEAVKARYDMDDGPVVHIISDEETIKGVCNDFQIATRMVDLRNEEGSNIYVADVSGRSSALITPDRVGAIVQDAIVEEDEDEDFITEYREIIENGDYEEYDFRSPGLTELMGAFREELGAGFADDYKTAMDVTGPLTGENGVDEVTLALIVGTFREELLYDLGRVMEDVGLASRATTSREKTTLEEYGLLETEKVPGDVGRPRQRLVLPADNTDRSVVEFVERVKESEK